ncbi:hypothetical protein IWY39_002599 [Sphingobium sp. JAI105]|uniref:hypothetical protein n=1 Tax=Sphingobium sp. JAI105 TaxID=2787715 RepID=UPI0018CB289F|nr:hypothetical protein [Sphingobium sp. JAI105]MBG6116235.1 hypothetical protein [Sphingobium sp. JAI105]MBG6118795.1 hypothetical protein [Sphingobium sp. JAI105]
MIHVIMPRKCGKTTGPVSLVTPDDIAVARIALYVASILRNVDQVALRDLSDRLATAARDDCIPRYADNSQLVRIMQRLGWRKHGYVGEGRGRSPLYRRVSSGVLTPIRRPAPAPRPAPMGDECPCEDCAGPHSAGAPR